ncbi:hypothetical protein [Amycolatopsis sp. NPDC051061]|uniref:hypothetical protein n=1 Tax=Amycolatopsis sp. NPDC051061 TaxID=3155042 RepID=UPI0034386B66
MILDNAEGVRVVGQAADGAAAAVRQAGEGVLAPQITRRLITAFAAGSREPAPRPTVSMT